MSVTDSGQTPAIEKPLKRRSTLFNALATIILLALFLFGAYKIALKFGYDLRDYLPNTSSAALSLRHLQSNADTAAQSQASNNLPKGELQNLNQAVVTTPVRDIPPTIQKNKPDFAIRDGMTYGYITNLDNETLQRLNLMAEQMTGMLTYTDQMGQAVQRFAQTLAPRMDHVQSQQNKLSADMSVLFEQLNRMDASISDIRANLLSSGRIKQASVKASGGKISGWQLQSTINGRAWLKTPSGKTVTVVKGDRLRKIGRIVSVNHDKIIMSDGRFIQ